jgi:4'-phosphopantetheinyl transferase
VSGAVAERAAGLLSDDERRSAEPASASVRRRRVVHRAALRTVLGGYLGRPPAALRFRYGAFGKPRLDEPAGLHFNLSRSEDRALIAVSRRGPIGVDVERRADLPDLDALAARTFAAVERERLDELGGERRVHGFWTCWTRKEAVAKAVGAGLSMPPTSFAVSLRDDEPAAVLSFANDEPRAWRIATLDPWPGYLGALAARVGERSRPIRLRSFPLMTRGGHSG